MMVPLSHPPPGEYGESIIPRKKVKLEDYSPNATSLDNDVKPTMLNHQTHDHRVHASPTHSASSHPGIATTTTPSHAVMHASGIMAAASAAQNEALDDQVGKETACGITEFVCPELLGFTGIMKKRCEITDGKSD